MEYDIKSPPPISYLLPPIFLFLLVLTNCLSIEEARLSSGWEPPQNSQTKTTPPDDTSLSPSLPPPSPLRITVLNVGQGDATLIQAPSGKTLLIDGGRDGKGREVILPFLKQKGISSLDAILATHYDGDHIGGIDEVIAGDDGVSGTNDDLVPKLGTYDRGGTPFDFAPFFPEYLQAAGEKRRSISPGEKIPLDPTVILRCVAVNGQIWNGPAVDLTPIGFSAVENSASIALLIEYGTFRYLTAGDLTGGGSPGGFKTFDVESPLAEVVGPVDIVHVNHHGSLTSSNEAYVNDLKPLAALFSVGDGNEYGHPAQEVLERWHNGGAELWMTEKGGGGFIALEQVVNGPIHVETDGESLTINEKQIAF